MRTSSGAVVLALLGDATAFSFSPVATRLRTPAPSTTAAGTGRHVFNNAASANILGAVTWPQTAAVRGGGLLLNASEEPAEEAAAAVAADGATSTRPPLDVAAIGR